MVQTVKFSAFASGGTLVAGDTTVGLDGGLNAKFTIPPQFVVPFTTATRPAPTNGLIGYNTDIHDYEYYNGTSWFALGTTADLAAFVASLAAHTPGVGASLVGLQDQVGVTGQTVQNLANAKFIVQTNNGSMVNAQALGSLTTGILKSATASGLLSISAPLTSIDGLSTSANQMIYTTGSNVYATTTLTAYARTLLDDIDATTARATLGLGSAATQNANFFLQVANNLSDVNSASTSRTNLGLGQAAVKSVTDNSKSIVASVSGAFTVGHVLLAADVSGTVKDGGSPAGMGTVTQVDTGAGLTGGPITASGTIALADIADADLLANVTGGPAPASGNSISSILDYVLGSTQGDIIYRSAANWTVLVPGTNGYFLKTQGAGANPVWAVSPGTGTVSAGLQNQLAYYAANGTTVSGLSTANNGLLVTSAAGVPSILAGPGTTGNILQSNAAAAPSFSTATYPSTGGAAGSVIISDGTNKITSTSLWPNTVGTAGKIIRSDGTTNAYTTSTFADTYLINTIPFAASANTIAGATLTAIIDAAIGNTQGNVLFRNSTVWTILAPGTNGQVLTTGGPAADVSWTTNGAGTVTSVATNNGLTGGTITSTGTLGLAAIADHTVLANISGGALYPSSTTLTALIDNAIGSTQGNILYRNGTVWTVLAPGTAGQVLQTGGAAANPAYSTATYPASATNAARILRSDGTNWVQTTSTFADTYGASGLLYANGSNNVAGLATANSGVLVTDVSGVPSISSTLPAFTTSSITFSPTTGGIVGTTTNDNAAAGKVGEVISSVIASGSAVAILNNTATNMTTISLTAGDWNVSANILFGNTTFTAAYIWISATSATFPDASLVNGINVATTGIGLNAPFFRASLSGTTTIYVSGFCSFAAGTANMAGGIYARRVR